MATVASQLPQALPMAELSCRAAWATKAITENLGRIEEKAPGVPTNDASELVPAKEFQVSWEGKDRLLRVRIFGAGVAGLFTAMTLDSLQGAYGLKVEYEILEADKRIGGRLYPYYFEDKHSDYPLGPHDYFDVGATRFPDNAIMSRTFKLFKGLKMNKIPEDSRPELIEKGSLVSTSSQLAQPSTEILHQDCFSEIIFEILDFDTKAKSDWWLVEGGVEQIAKRIHNRLKNPEAIKLNTNVRGISYTDNGRKKLEVSVVGESEHRQYDAMFNSASLGAMQQMQLEGLKLNWGTNQAIRSLGYGASCKVGIRFKTLWRAERLGALISRNSPDGEAELKEVLIHDLARLHACSDDDGSDYRGLHALVSDQYLDHYAYSWYTNSHTAGAFAYFGPGQFKHMYPWITRNDGKHIVIGEAASAHHAWVVGVLDSAVRGVYQFLCRHAKINKGAATAAKAYEDGDVPEPYGSVQCDSSWTTEMKMPAGSNLT